MHDWYRKRKLKRDASLAKYKRENPDMTLETLGKIFKISKQRVSIILKSQKGGRARVTYYLPHQSSLPGL